MRLDQVLPSINLVLSGLLGIVCLAVFVLWVWPHSAEDFGEPSTPRRVYPKNPFVQDQASYDRLGEPLMSLRYSPPLLELPDLRTVLTYHGTNRRPDAERGRTLLHFSLPGLSAPQTVVPGEPMYLVYDKSKKPATYAFSPANSSTALWFEAAAEGDEVIVNLRMRNDQGIVISEPNVRAQFRLKERQLVAPKGDQWMLGSLRVDGTLLARQRARWYGEDLFLTRHGGIEYAHAKDRQRIDIGEGDQSHSVFIGMNECLIWDGQQWAPVEAGDSSRDFPLLCLTKLAERVMTFDFWDVAGKRKVVINLIKSSEVWTPGLLEKDFKFVGARTRTQTIVEIRGERVILRPMDWLLLGDDGWQKLATEQEIDDYVARKVRGPLLIFEGVDKSRGQPLLLGTLFNSSRTASHRVELAASSQTKAPTVPSRGQQPAAPVQRVPNPRDALDAVPARAPVRELTPEEERFLQEREVPLELRSPPDEEVDDLEDSTGHLPKTSRIPRRGSTRDRS